MLAEATSRGQTYMQKDQRFAAPDEEDAARLETGLEIVNAFREIDPKMPSSYMAMFLAVAKEPGRGPTHYAETLGTIQPMASRILLEIGIKARERAEPLGLVDRAQGEDLRSQAYFLTPKGRILERKLLNVLRRAARTAKG